MKSEKSLRIYDRRGFTRCELEARKKSAHAIVENWLETPLSMKGWLCGVATWNAPWFAEFLAAPLRVTSTATTSEFHLQRFRRYLHRLVPTLKIARELWGDGLDEWINSHDYDLTGPQIAKRDLLLEELRTHPELARWPV